MVRLSRLVAGLCAVAVLLSLVLGLPAAGALPHARAATGGLLFAAGYSGTTADGRHSVSLSVSKAAAGQQAVNLSIYVLVTGTVPPGSPTAGPPPPAALSGSYSFVLPARDLTVGAGGATLDTGRDLGSYGRIVIRWRYTSPARTVSGSYPCTPGRVSGQQITAVAVATVSLTLPCEGRLTGPLHGTSSPVSTGAVVPAARSVAAGTVLPASVSLSFYGSYRPQMVNVMVSRLGDGPAILQVQTSAMYSTTSGLTSVSHTATDVLSARQFAADMSADPVATIHYSGALGYLALTARGESGPQTRFTPAGGAAFCGAGSAVALPYNTTIQNPTVGGWVDLRVCGTAVTQTLKHQSVFLQQTGSQPLPGAFLPRRVSPANGARGVGPQSPIVVTFTQPLATTGGVSFTTVRQSPPQPVAGLDVQEATVAGGGWVSVGQPTVDPSTTTLTWWPQKSTPLKPHTRYKVHLTAQSVAGGLVDWTTYFTTGG